MSVFLRRSLRTRRSNIKPQIQGLSSLLANSFDSLHHTSFHFQFSQSPWLSSNSLSSGSYCYGYASHRRQGGAVFPTSKWVRLLGSEAAATTTTTQHSTSDGLTVDGILANNWSILEENEGDWKSHATAIAQSVSLIKRRLQWKKLKVRLDMLSSQLNKPDLWDDPVHAGKISREHGSLIGKVKEVNALEQELLEHIDMLKLAREENDAELESESLKALLNMRRNTKEKELEALLVGEHDSCSCYIEVVAMDQYKLPIIASILS